MIKRRVLAEVVRTVSLPRQGVTSDMAGKGPVVTIAVVESDVFILRLLADGERGETDLFQMQIDIGNLHTSLHFCCTRRNC